MPAQRLYGFFSPEILEQIEENVRVYEDAYQRLRGIVPTEVVEGGSVDLENWLYENKRDEIRACLNTMEATRDDIRNLLGETLAQLDRLLIDLVDSDWSRIIPALVQLMQTVPESPGRR